MTGMKQLRWSLILATFLAASLAASNQLVHDPDTSACLSKINEYLQKFGIDSDGLEGNQQQKIKMGELLSDQVIMALDQAKHHLDRPLVSDESPESVFRALNPSNKCSRRRLTATVAGIHDAFESCDQVSLDYLLIVANYELKAGDRELVNRLARNRVELCWQRFIMGASRQLNRVMGKMTRPVFKNLERIAEIMIEAGKSSTRSKATHAMGTIHIDEQKARDRASAEAESELRGEDQTSLDMMDTRPETFLAILETIKSIDFNRDERVREFSRTIHKLFKEQQAVATTDKRERSRLLRDFLSSFFVEPCRELISRVRSIVALGRTYRSHVEQTLSQALADEKQSNPVLDYQLEVYRVCSFGVSKGDKIIEFLEKL